MTRELTVTLRFTCNEAEAMRRAMRYATHPINTDEWADSVKIRRSLESAMSKVITALDRWERR